MTDEIFINRPESRSKTQMIAEAKQVHPDATARLNEFTNTWEIIITTPYVDSYTLDDRFIGTPAWDAFNEQEASYGDNLSRWGYKNGHGEESLESLAEIFNAHIEERKRKLQLADAYLAEKGLKPFEEMTADELNNLSDEVHKQYMEAFKIIGW